LSYFRPQQAENTGLRITSQARFSTFTLSQKPGRVNQVGVPTVNCLNGGVHPKLVCQMCANSAKVGVLRAPSIIARMAVTY
jgi:hypothetical protein